METCQNFKDGHYENHKVTFAKLDLVEKNFIVTVCEMRKKEQPFFFITVLRLTTGVIKHLNGELAWIGN